MKKLFTLTMLISFYPTTSHASEKKQAKAYAEAQSKCSSGDMDACKKQGDIEDERGHLENARNLYQKACDGGQREACGSLGAVFEFGMNDYERAKKAYDHACGVGVDCDYLPLFMEHYQIRAKCEQGDKDACIKYGVNLIIARQNKKAEDIFKPLCNTGYAEGCFRMGFLKDEPQGNHKAAIPWYRLGCAKGSMVSCLNLGEIAYEKHNIGEAKRTWAYACIQNDSASCDRLATIYLNQGDYAEARALLFKACNLGSQIACDDLHKAGL